MAHFFKSDNSNMDGYDATENKQYLEVDKSSDVTLWGGGADSEKLVVAMDDPTLAKVDELSSDKQDLRNFLLRGKKLGKGRLEAKNSKGELWASMPVDVVEAMPITAPPAGAVPRGKTTVNAPGKQQKTSKEGREWIKKSEDLKLEYYWIDSEAARKDPEHKGNCTVGWGHLVYHGPCKPPERGGSITQAQAEEYFEGDVGGKENFVNSKKLDLTQTEFDAIVDLAFQSWRKEVEQALKDGDKKKAADALGALPGERAERRKILFSEGRYVNRGEK